MSGTNIIKSKCRQMLLGFKLGVQTCTYIKVVQDVATEPDAEGNFTMILSDDSINDAQINIDVDIMVILQNQLGELKKEINANNETIQAAASTTINLLNDL